MDGYYQGIMLVRVLVQDALPLEALGFQYDQVIGAPDLEALEDY
jgi:hypothetical protein